MAANDEPCKRCGSTDTTFVLLEDGMHWGKDQCAVCGAYKRWIPKPDDGRKREKASTSLAVKYGIEHCEMCLRRKDELPPPRVIFGHHVIEHQDGGSNERSNIWGLCKHCHELVALVRRSIGHNKLTQKDHDALPNQECREAV
jgi:hypothetical protein